MANFKVGDRVRRVSDYNWNSMKAGEIDIIVAITESTRGDLLELKVFGEGHASRRFELVESSPIRTVTKREIVAGQYGKVRLSNPYDSKESVAVVLDECFMYATDFRAAAKLFNEIADVLDGNAGALAG